ncbi:FAD-dependent oxidoreductase [Microbulbifer halophilus]|uniref:FAD-dependent oxidoreductase n=1 Tax=Microbulbifer halophilus TaxID=453963 RepID=A0ABW5EB89_9GAMM|nr:NAD(P)/FAD-dependent oxidoreductase [Microbulbifer halophilus]MCW8127912.1 NAD(P)/FAD-dependent oxidoreductase [Microbulbifer halophilus]
MNPVPPSTLVVGAGASGLAFALVYAQAGANVRIIDKRKHRSMTGKATGVAQGVWNQLHRFGITSSVLAAATPMRNFVFHDDEALIANVPVPEISGRAPAHLYPQWQLECDMEKALVAYGVEVEYGITLVEFHQSREHVQATLKHNDEPRTEQYETDWLIGADGAHSDTRRILNLPFPGRDYPGPWSVAEIATSLWPRQVQAQLFLHRDGVGLFLSQPSHGAVQGILNAKGAASELKKRFADAELRYEREFQVSLRRVSKPRLGRVWLIGDSAHVQSPVGGQGLNLAIWDGITLANALLNADLTVERRLASRARRTLLFTDFDYRMLATRNRAIRILRNFYWSFASRYPIVAKWFFRIISGAW